MVHLNWLSLYLVFLTPLIMLFKDAAAPGGVEPEAAAAAAAHEGEEEKIEFMNAKIGRWIQARIKDLNISHYKRVTSIMKCIQDIMLSFSKLFNRKEQENENERLRMMYTKARWNDTNIQFREWILDQFEKALSGDVEDSQWPREDPFERGLLRILIKFAPELRTWIEQQRRLSDDDDMENDEEGENDEEEKEEEYEGDLEE